MTETVLHSGMSVFKNEYGQQVAFSYYNEGEIHLTQLLSTYYTWESA